MTSIHEWVTASGGVLHKRDLVALGASDRDLTRAVRSGAVRRPRRGWYSTFSPDDSRFLALRVGGRLTGAAALHLLGAWMWTRAPNITVSVPRNAARLRKVRGTRVVYDEDNVVKRGSAWAVDRRDALARAIVESSFEEAVALWDWARTEGGFDDSDLDDVKAALPSDARGVEVWSDGESDSFLESVTRVRLVENGHAVISQVPVGMNQAIDLVVDGVVGLELDGREFHAETFEKDRKKDLSIMIEGRIPLRASYEMVRRAWPRVLDAVSRGIELHRRSGHLPHPQARPPDYPRLMYTRSASQRADKRQRRTWRCSPRQPMSSLSATVMPVR